MAPLCGGVWDQDFRKLGPAERVSRIGARIYFAGAVLESFCTALRLTLLQQGDSRLLMGLIGFQVLGCETAKGCSLLSGEEGWGLQKPRGSELRVSGRFIVRVLTLLHIVGVSDSQDIPAIGYKAGGDVFRDRPPGSITALFLQFKLMPGRSLNTPIDFSTSAS